MRQPNASATPENSLRKQGHRMRGGDDEILLFGLSVGGDRFGK
ncbi:MAG: hypothetical protein AB8G99_16795 [Planctomycetaceae bacterium]